METNSGAHSHDHGQNRLGWALIITAGYMIAEAAGGYFFNSLALLADAGHMLSDVMALGLSWIAMRIGRRAPTDQHTFGFRRFEILAAFINGLALWLIVGLIFYEAQKRFGDPQPVQADGMMIIATVGLAVNIVMAALLFRDRSENLNIRSAFIHIIGDALGSLGAIIAAIGIIFTGAYWLDPLVSILVGFLILYSSWDLIRESVHILMEGVPRGIDAKEVEQEIVNIEGVCCIHDLHIWSITSEKNSLAAHIVMDDPQRDRELMIGSINKKVAEKFNITHTTIQIEPDHDCAKNCIDGSCRPSMECGKRKT